MNILLRNIFGIILLFLVEFSIAQSNQPMLLGLPEAVAIAQSKSPSARVIHSNFEAARWRYKVSTSIFYPQISLGGNIPGLNRSINNITQPDGTVLYLPQSQAISRANFSIVQDVLATGGTVYVSSSLGRIDLFGNQKAAYWQAQPLVIGISQPLFKLNRMKWNRKQEVLRYKGSEKQRIEAEEDLAIRVSDAWFSFYVAQLNHKNSEKNVKFNDTLYIISKGRFELGKIAETELLQVELSLLNAKNNFEQNGVELGRAEQQLKNLLGLDQKVEIALNEPPGILPMKVDTARAAAEAMENRSDIIQMVIRKNDAVMNMKENNMNRFFQADLNANFGLNQSAAYLHQAYQNPLNSQTLNIGFNIPIASFGRNKGNYMAAKNSYDAVVADMENSIYSLLLEVVTSAQKVQQLERSVIISHRAREIAEKRYELSRNRYMVGKIDITNLTIAQNEKDNALLSYASNLSAYWSAYYRLRRLTLYDFAKEAKIQ